MADDGLQFSQDHYVEVAEHLYQVQGEEAVAKKMQTTYYQRGTVPDKETLLGEVLKQDLHQSRDRANGVWAEMQH